MKDLLGRRDSCGASPDAPPPTTGFRVYGCLLALKSGRGGVYNGLKVSPGAPPPATGFRVHSRLLALKSGRGGFYNGLRV